MIRLLCVGLLLLGSLFPVRLCAQQYDTMWKQVEDLQKKDLVESVIGAVDGIYRKAEAERNLPQRQEYACMFRKAFPARA